MNERRRDERPTTTVGYLQQLPGLVLLDRLPTPVIAVHSGGEMSYANPAFAQMLGHFDSADLTGRPVSAFLCKHEQVPAEECVDMLRNSCGGLVDWWHAEGFAVRTLVSKSMLLRSVDPLILISLNDMTEWLWTNAGKS